MASLPDAHGLGVRMPFLASGLHNLQALLWWRLPGASEWHFQQWAKYMASSEPRIRRVINDQDATNHLRLHARSGCRNRRRFTSTTLIEDQNVQVLLLRHRGYLRG